MSGNTVYALHAIIKKTFGFSHIAGYNRMSFLNCFIINLSLLRVRLFS